MKPLISQKGDSTITSRSVLFSVFPLKKSESCQNHLPALCLIFSAFFTLFLYFQFSRSFCGCLQFHPCLFLGYAAVPWHHRIRARRHSFSQPPPFCLLTSHFFLYSFFPATSLLLLLLVLPSPRFTFSFSITLDQFTHATFLLWISPLLLLSDDCSSPAAITGRRRTTTFCSKIHIDRLQITNYRLNS